MGGKNKKHKAPGAAAVRAAVSASRAKSAEAGAAGEAQSKKPVARPPPAAAASSKEPRVKQGTSGCRVLGFPPEPLLLVPREKPSHLGGPSVSKFASSTELLAPLRVALFEMSLSCLGLPS